MNITVSAGVTAQSFKINIVNSDLVECTETFNVRIKSVTSCGFAIGSINITKVMITDNSK